MPTGFDLRAKEFDTLRGAVPEKELEAVRRHLGKARTVLDVGGGTGRYAAPLAERGFQITVFDRSAPMLQQARKKGLHSTVRGDAARLPFLNASFDGLLMVDVLHHVGDWVSAVHEMGRVARGPIVMSVSTREPSARFVYLSVRARMGKPSGRLDGGAFALLRILPPRDREVVSRETIHMDFAKAIREQEFDPEHPDRPRFPEIAEAAVREAIDEYGGSEIEGTVTCEVARWEAENFRIFTSPRA
jgi:ubiquinone/menaquinone biosynthesis C-methylase UbiE